MGKTHLLNAIGLEIRTTKKVMFISAERFMYHFILSLKNNEMVKFKDLFRKSNVFIMPSIIHKKSVEGFGIVFVEAAQYGIPSIGGGDGGASDAIIHDKTGLICDGNNLEEIYSSIDSMLKNNLYKEYGKKAKEYSKKFEWENIVKKYLNIL